MTKSLIENFSPHLRHFVESRWKEWEPYLLMKARKDSDHPDQALQRWRDTYLLRTHILVQQSIRWPVIRKHNLDNPLVSDETFRDEMAKAHTRAVLRRGWNRSKGSRKGVESQS